MLPSCVSSSFNMRRISLSSERKAHRSAALTVCFSACWTAAEPVQLRQAELLAKTTCSLQATSYHSDCSVVTSGQKTALQALHTCQCNRCILHMQHQQSDPCPAGFAKTVNVFCSMSSELMCKLLQQCSIVHGNKI